MASRRTTEHKIESSAPQHRKGLSSEQGQAYWDRVVDFSKKNPLASSFLATQATFSGGPLLVFAAVAVSTLILSIGTALVTTAGVIGTSLFAISPVLFFTASAATLTWLGLVLTYATLTWIYNSIYQDSYIDHSIHDLTSQAAKIKREIEENASKEFNGYISSAEELGHEARQNVEKGYAQLQEAGRDVNTNVQKKLQPARDKANAAWNATADTANGVKNDLLHDDGVVDGLNAKKDRAANTVANKTS